MMRSGWQGWRRKNRSQPSHSPGKDKGERCTTSPMKKFFACSPKAYKHKQYMEWHNKFKGYSGQR